eukprot:112418-Amphidinium_carterae.1
MILAKLLPLPSVVLRSQETPSTVSESMNLCASWSTCAFEEAQSPVESVSSWSTSRQAHTNNKANYLNLDLAMASLQVFGLFLWFKEHYDNLVVDMFIL